jgi:hypothetical protein
MSEEIISFLSPHLREHEEIPEGFSPLTHPIKIHKADVIRSIWSSLEGTEALCTCSNGSVVFWRKIVRLPYHGDQKGKVRTR